MEQRRLGSTMAAAVEALFLPCLGSIGIELMSSSPVDLPAAPSIVHRMSYQPGAWTGARHRYGAPPPARASPASPQAQPCSLVRVPKAFGV